MQGDGTTNLGVSWTCSQHILLPLFILSYFTLFIESEHISNCALNETYSEFQLLRESHFETASTGSKKINQNLLFDIELLKRS